MQVEIGDKVLLVGTAHVSKTSVLDVQRAIAERNPDVVAVELDAIRHKAITQKRDWEETPITRIIKDKNLYFFLAQILLASYQRRMGEDEGVEPGAEMVAALQAGEAAGAEVVLADRDIGVTFRRAFASMGFRERMRVSWELIKALVGIEKQDEEGPKTVDELLDQDIITTMMEELGDFAPSIKSVLIDERDLYLATRIREAAKDGKSVVAVVGAGHLRGIQKQLEDPRPVSLDLLEQVPEKRVKMGKVIGWGIPLLIVVFFAYLAYQGFQQGNYQEFLDAALAWILIVSSFAAVGALLGGGHVLSAGVAFLCAPFAVLHPLIASGWFAGLTEAWLRKPKVKDFEGLAKMMTLRDMYRNDVMRIILVTAICNVFAMIGSTIANIDLIRRVF